MHADPLGVQLLEKGTQLQIHTDSTGDKLYQEMAAWFKDESEARQELIASAKTLTVRLQSMDTSLAAAEQNVSDLQKVREVLECKLADIQRVQVANLASHAADLEKFEHKVQEALAAKDEVYRDLVSAQQVQGELKETLVRFPLRAALNQ